MVGLVDTAIVIDVLRGHPPALNWLSGQGELGVTPAVWLEIIEGARDQPSQQKALKLLRSFRRVEMEEQDFEWAITQALQYRLSHGVGVMDCLIAASSARLQIQMFTTNLKHFGPLLGDLAVAPY